MKSYLEVDVSGLSKQDKEKFMNTYRNIHLYEMDLMGVYEHYIIIEVDCSKHGHNLTYVPIMREAKLSEYLLRQDMTVEESFKRKYPDFTPA